MATRTQNSTWPDRTTPTALPVEGPGCRTAPRRARPRCSSRTS